MPTRRRFLAQCFAGVALAPAARLLAQRDAMPVSKFNVAGSAWVDPHYELSAQVLLRGVSTPLGGGTYKLHSSGREALLTTVTGDVPLAAQDKLSVKFLTRHKEGGEDGFLEVLDFTKNFSRDCLVRGGSGVAARVRVTARFVQNSPGSVTLYVETVPYQ